MSARGWLIAALLAGCGGAPVESPPPGFAACPASADDAGAAGPVVDYWHDAKPILDRRCATCHAADGIAPFPLSTYADAQGSALLIQGVVESRTMPPWPPNGCCRTYAHDRSLAAAERDLLLRWLEAGAPEGDPQGAPPSLPPALPSLARVDVTMRMREPYVPAAQAAGTSERRCFLLEDWPFAQEKLVTGVDVRPGNRAVVHQVTVQIVDDGDLPALRARDGADGRPGFDCRDVPAAIEVDGVIAGWTPGAAPFESPDATLGLPFPAGARLMLQIGYDGRDTVAGPDQTEIDFQVADAVAHRANGLVVTSHDPPTQVTQLEPFFLHSVALHMREGGSRGRLAIHRADGSWDCLLDVPSWDGRWATPYQLAQPVEVRPGDRLYVECHWKDTAARPLDDTCVGQLLYTDAWP